MIRSRFVAALLLATAFGVVSAQVAEAQRRYYGSQRSRYGQQSARRIDALERRVAALERQLGRRERDPLPPGPLSTTPERAEQQVTAAEEKLRFSSDLFRKGYISEAEFEEDKYLLERANKVLRLSNTEQRSEATDEITREIAVFDAAHNLAVAERQLQLAERIAAQGFLGVSGIAAHRQAVAEARDRLAEAQAPAPE